MFLIWNAVLIVVVHLLCEVTIGPVGFAQPTKKMLSPQQLEREADRPPAMAGAD